MKSLCPYRIGTASLILTTQLCPVDKVEALVPPQQRNTSLNSRQLTTLLKARSAPTVDRMLQLLPQDDNTRTDEIRELFDELAQNSGDDEDDVSALFGEYEVAKTLPTKESPRPVGGKWKASMAWQHIEPPNRDSNNNKTDKDAIAQVINLIRLRIFWCTIHVMLRGDAYSVGPKTIRAEFEAPRIVLLRRWALSLGPPSSVVLETPYCDDRIRLGQGSRGSRFVFVRTKMKVEDDWRPLYDLKNLGKRGLISGLMTLTTFGALWSGRFRFAMAICFFAVALVVQSTGGIEVEKKIGDADMRLADKAS